MATRNKLSLPLVGILTAAGCWGDGLDTADVGETSAVLRFRGGCDNGACCIRVKVGKCGDGDPNGYNFCEPHTLQNVQTLGESCWPAGTTVDYPALGGISVTGLEPGKKYGWYVEGRDGTAADVNPTWTKEQMGDFMGTEIAPQSFVTLADEARPARPTASAETDQGFVNWGSWAVGGRDLGLSVALNGKIVWMFGDTAVTPGQCDIIHANTSGYSTLVAGDTTTAKAMTGQNTIYGGPVEFISTANDPALPAGWRHVAWPSGAITSGGAPNQVAYVFYTLFDQYFGAGEMQGVQKGIFVDTLRSTGGIPRPQTGGERRMIQGPVGDDVPIYHPSGYSDATYAYFFGVKRNNEGQLFLARGKRAIMADGWPEFTVASKWEYWTTGTTWVLNSPTSAKVWKDVRGHSASQATMGKVGTRWVLVAQKYIGQAGDICTMTSFPAGACSEWKTIRNTAQTTDGYGNYFFAIHNELTSGNTMVLSYANKDPALNSIQNIRLHKVTLQ